MTPVFESPSEILCATLSVSLSASLSMSLSVSLFMTPADGGSLAAIKTTAPDSMAVMTAIAERAERTVNVLMAVTAERVSPNPKSCVESHPLPSPRVSSLSSLLPQLFPTGPSAATVSLGLASQTHEARNP